MIQIETFNAKLKEKTSWGTKELLVMTQNMAIGITRTLKDDGVIESGGKKIEVSYLKKYDVVYVNTIGLVHYLLIHSIDRKNNKVTGIVFSTKETAHTLHKIIRNRHFRSTNTFATNTYLTIDLDVAMKRYSRTFESKTEANLIFKKYFEYINEKFIKLI